MLFSSLTGIVQVCEPCPTYVLYLNAIYIAAGWTRGVWCSFAGLSLEIRLKVYVELLERTKPHDC